MCRKIIAYILVMVGALVMMYPRAITEYSRYSFRKGEEKYINQISTITSEELRERVEKMISLNEHIYKDSYVIEHETYDPFVTAENVKKRLSFLGNDDVFAYLVIPKLDECMPLYLGATEEHLFDGVAQMAETSLPIGGKNTHSVIAGHRGYYRSLLFRHIDKLVKGDRIYIYVYGRKLAYEVTGTEIISPDDVDSLQIIEGKDLITLLSCHPFPYMSHRLLVHGERVIDNTVLESDYILENVEFKTNLNRETVERIWRETVPEIDTIRFKEVEISETKNIYDESKTEDGHYEIEMRRKTNYLIIGISLIVTAVILILIIKEIRVYYKVKSKK